MLEFLERYFAEYQRSPLIREVQTACQIASYKSAIDRLNALEHKGVIKRLPNKHRGIKLTKNVVPEARLQATEAMQGIAEKGLAV